MDENAAAVDLVTPAFPTPTLPTGAVVPAIVAARGDQAAWRYLEFFTANIRNLNTRRAYARAASEISRGAIFVI